MSDFFFFLFTLPWAPLLISDPGLSVVSAIWHSQRGNCGVDKETYHCIFNTRRQKRAVEINARGGRWWPRANRVIRVCWRRSALCPRRWASSVGLRVTRQQAEWPLCFVISQVTHITTLKHAGGRALGDAGCIQNAWFPAQCKQIALKDQFNLFGAVITSRESCSDKETEAGLTSVCWTTLHTL